MGGGGSGAGGWGVGYSCLTGRLVVASRLSNSITFRGEVSEQSIASYLLRQLTRALQLQVSLVPSPHEMRNANQLRATTICEDALTLSSSALLAVKAGNIYTDDDTPVAGREQ